MNEINGAITQIVKRLHGLTPVELAETLAGATMNKYPKERKLPEAAGPQSIPANDESAEEVAAAAKGEAAEEVAAAAKGEAAEVVECVVDR